MRIVIIDNSEVKQLLGNSDVYQGQVNIYFIQSDSINFYDDSECPGNPPYKTDSKTTPANKLINYLTQYFFSFGNNENQICIQLNSFDYLIWHPGGLNSACEYYPLIKDYDITNSPKIIFVSSTGWEAASEARKQIYQKLEEILAQKSNVNPKTIQELQNLLNQLNSRQDEELKKKCCAERWEVKANLLAMHLYDEIGNKVKRDELISRIKDILEDLKNIQEETKNDINNETKLKDLFQKIDS